MINKPLLRHALTVSQFFALRAIQSQNLVYLLCKCLFFTFSNDEITRAASKTALTLMLLLFIRGNRLGGFT